MDSPGWSPKAEAGSSLVDRISCWCPSTQKAKSNTITIKIVLIIVELSYINKVSFNVDEVCHYTGSVHIGKVRMNYFRVC